MTTTPRNIIQKIWDAHVVSQKPGHPAVFAIDVQLIHEVTSAQAFKMLKDRGLAIWNPKRFFATLDHAVPTRVDRINIFDPEAKNQVETLRQNVKDFGVQFFDFDSGYQGIVHVIGPELGITQPGITIVCGDSHTSTHGAFGALAFGVGTTEVGLVMATGCLLRNEPKTMRVEFKGRFKPGVTAKDAILKLISQIGIGGANEHIIEYCGTAVEEMSMEERMTVCNMSIECGARAGLVAPDQTTFDYIKGRKHAPKGRQWEEAVAYWQTLKSDAGATYDHEIVIDVSVLDPMITWGTNPGQGMELTDTVPLLDSLPVNEQLTAEKALEYTQLQPGQSMVGLPIQWAFLGSCTNARLPDLKAAADIMKGKKLAAGVTMYVVPGSEQVKKDAEQLGLDKIFIDAGCSWRNPGCSMCLGMNDDKVPAGDRCLSTSNRNFVGRQGTGSITHLASPIVVAKSAIAGKICF